MFFLLDTTDQTLWWSHSWCTHTCIQMNTIQILLMFSNSVKGFYEKKHRDLSLLLFTFLYDDDTCDVCEFVSSYGQIVKEHYLFLNEAANTSGLCGRSNLDHVTLCLLLCVAMKHTLLRNTLRECSLYGAARPDLFPHRWHSVWVCECVSSSTRGISFYLNTSWR